MLSRPLALHDPQCSGHCNERACILDVEGFVASVIDRHLAGGAKRGDGSLSAGGGWLGRDDLQDLRAYLIAETWHLSTKYDPRGSAREHGDAVQSRLAGYVLQQLHWRVTDFLRARFGSTRYSVRRPELVPFDARKHDGGMSWDDYPCEREDGRRLDRDQLSPLAAEGLCVLELALETDTPQAIVARELGVAVSRIALLRREAVIVG